MLNFRKLKKDFSHNVLDEGKTLHEKKMILSAKIVTLNGETVRLSCQVLGNFDHIYACEIEIDRQQSTIIDSNCDCTYKYDCQHLAAVVFYLEKHLDALLVAYSKEANFEDEDTEDPQEKQEKQTLKKTLVEAQTKESERKEKILQKELLEEYVKASQMLGKSPFFLPEEHLPQDPAELLVIFSPQKESASHPYEIQLALRLVCRSKPLHVQDVREFLDAVRYGDPLTIGNRRFSFSLNSFDSSSKIVLKQLLDHAFFHEAKAERNPRLAYLESEILGMILAQIHEYFVEQLSGRLQLDKSEGTDPCMPCFYVGSWEEPLRLSNFHALLRVELEYLESPAPKILLNPTLLIRDKIVPILEDVRLFECAKSGTLYQNVYYRFEPHIKRRHLRHLLALQEVTIPEPLFGTFVENSLAELMRFAEVTNQEIVEKFVTLPFTGDLRASCYINYLNGELEASLAFIYDGIEIPAAQSALTTTHLKAFMTPHGILARNLTEERKITEALFRDFFFDAQQGVFRAKSEKKIVEFMTESVPCYQDRVEFHCPENLLEQFVYDETRFSLKLREVDRVDVYEIDLKVIGPLQGISVEVLWDCLASKKNFIELSRMSKQPGRKGKAQGNKILVLDLEKLAPIVQVFDDLGITTLENHAELRPLWSLANAHAGQFKDLAIDFSMSAKLKKIQAQMLNNEPIEVQEVSKDVKATLRQYQKEGVGWLERLRKMFLNGILADDMGLGKTLQAITSLTHYKKERSKSVSLVVCPTSLVYNWKEECNKFNAKLKVLPVDGHPQNRKRLLEGVSDYDVVVTSYTLLQKDIELYTALSFGYVILDEAHHIKNRTTRNAKSVKQLKAEHRLILTGTPVENCLEELWSLFDFLMPGLLSTFDRFVEKYIRNTVHPQQGSPLEHLRRKLSPFILRRMKKDVVADLPPVSEIVYHCHLSDRQRELYSSYVKTAREELSQLVKKEGFEKVQIHVLATLTRLKQICCHPAIFAKEKAEEGDSSKYEMLMELVQTLVAGKHKTVIFSQYTKMLQIMRKDLQNSGIRFEYLDGSTKNRLEIVNRFNQDEHIPIFLVSLRAGGTGLNLVGANTVIHYDMWWNPAVENQATDRVHRIGQERAVSCFKLVTLDTIEEKIVQLQDRKRGLVKKIINTDEEAISKLTWEEVLELLQT